MKLNKKNLKKLKKAVKALWDNNRKMKDKEIIAKLTPTFPKVTLSNVRHARMCQGLRKHKIHVYGTTNGSVIKSAEKCLKEIKALVRTLKEKKREFQSLGF